jgi:hypothetical protein
MQLRSTHVSAVGRVISLVLAASLAASVIVLAAACGGEGDEAAAPQEPAAGATAEATKKPKPISSLPPLVGIGDTVRFETPDGAVVRVTAGDHADPGDAPSGATADSGERLVTLELSVTPEGAEGTASVPLPFEKADSFILVAEDDTLTVAQLGDEDLLGMVLPPGETISTTLAFSVGAASPIRFVCTPVEGSRPRSATWDLDR